MKYLAVLASIIAVAVADTPVTGNWTLYCGSSCDSTTEAASGTLTSGDGCARFDSTFEYCRFEGTYFFLAGLDSDPNCHGTEGVTLAPGDCTSAGKWFTHEISAFL
ncbi:uncharacterized protein TRUGW13939_09413 [Talaromyces rugulosus]|uniref:Uncharacterized protein n=1 Tax=Talaromyces rugulosus TaxID=121627 RepID=A0A7H8R7A9_TALRU|nr:uncharacterized protein TRUGW13939_09413 [Talaromyces rugulosus]QKX62254.1 hypothetical protein TRUGW13939_09413 [Talaromyces rugulosus]